MADKQLLTQEQQRRNAAEIAWLRYFNQVLFQKNIISEQERNRMANMIAMRKPSAAASKKHSSSI